PTSASWPTSTGVRGHDRRHPTPCLARHRGHRRRLVVLRHRTGPALRPMWRREGTLIALVRPMRRRCPRMAHVIPALPMTRYAADDVDAPVPTLNSGLANRLLERSAIHAWTRHPKYGAEGIEANDAMNIGSA